MFCKIIRISFLFFCYTKNIFGYKLRQNLLFTLFVAIFRAVVHSGPPQVIRTQNGTPYFIHWGRLFYFQISLLKFLFTSVVARYWTRNSLSQVTRFNQWFYPLKDISVWILGTYKPNVSVFNFFYHSSYYNFLLLFFSSPLYYWFPYCINFYAWPAQGIFVA